MNSKELNNIWEVYTQVYEEVGVKVPSGSSDTEALRGLIPKGDKVHEVPKKKSTLQNASYEPEGEIVEEQENDEIFNYLLEYLVAEGYADTNKAALAIMANMSEEWKQSIVEGGFPGTPSTPRPGDAGTSGLKMIRTTGGGTGYTNKYSSGETLPSGTVNKIMSGQLMVKKQSNTDTKTA